MDAPAAAVVRWWAPPAWAARASLVSAFAMLGVLSRLYLGQAFLSANVTGTFSALFIDLPANVAGSFLLGVASSGAVVGHGRVASPPPAGAAAEYAWGILPQGSAVNRLGALVDVNVGFRTGYCGSFTTVRREHPRAAAAAVAARPSAERRGTRAAAPSLRAGTCRWCS